MSSREQILARVRRALADVPADEPRTRAPGDGFADSHGVGPTLEVLEDRLHDYRALVRRVAPDRVAAEVAAALERRGAARVAVPAGVPQEWFAESSVELLRDSREEPVPVSGLDGVDGVVTGCSVAVAETGTIVLDGGPDQGRRVITLVPDYHLCVVRADQVVDGVPQAVRLLDPSLPLTWISGPSATSDIELDRVEGVHGPRTLEVLLVGSGD
ncbi:LutC/YkgG family protein [Nocardiopsis quinghaiensis]|uniref:LutC/YkgG family protein n=1 Tax=Nocardiopsis quinghaiensis TaxID=464995 RepID=UPI00123AA0FA|nr:LUD domain-containing protein [Nocardiopsis quinghaiensis]